MHESVIKKNTVNVLLFILMILITGFALFPFLWMIMLSFKTSTEILNNPLSLPKSLAFSNYREAMERVNFLKMYGNTIYIALCAIILQMVFSFMSSFALAKMEFNAKIKSNIYTFLIAGLTISSFILLFPIYRITTVMKARDTLGGLILPYVATSISFNTLLMVSFLKNLPKEIDEAAIIDGCNLFQLCTRVVLPLAKPVFATLIVFSALYIFNEYPLASIIIDSKENYTLSLTASLFKGEYLTNYGATIASSILIIIPELFFYVFFQRYIVDGITAGAVKG